MTVNEMTRVLSIVVVKRMTFDDVVAGLRDALHVAFSIENKKGRRIAGARTHEFTLSVIDREDGLGDFLSDECCVVDIEIGSADLFTAGFEDRIRAILMSAEIAWDRGVWSRLSRDEDLRTLHA